MSGEEILAIRAYEDVIMYRAIADAVEDPSIDVLHNNSFSGIPFLLSRFIDLAMFHTLRVPPIFSSMTEALQFCMAEDIAEWQTSHEKLSFQSREIGNRIFTEAKLEPTRV